MKYKFLEFFCVAAAALFIFFSVTSERGSEKNIEMIGESICSSVDLKGLSKRDNLFFKKTFDHSSDEFEGLIYYSADDVMDVREMLVVKLKDGSDASAFVSELETYISDRYNIYAAYAPEQGEYLKQHILKTNGNMLFLYVGPDAAKAQDAFSQSL